MKYKLMSITVVLLCLVTPGFAALQIELTQSTSSALPIAIVPFINGAATQVAGDTTISSVIKDDLQNSGQFRVVNSEEPGVAPQSLVDGNVGQWRNQGADFVLMGQVKPSIGGHYAVSIRLVNLFNDAGKKTEKIILGETWTTTKSGLRGLAHRISDAVYKELTGVRGVFSTKIAYVLVRHPGNSAPSYELDVADADGFNPQALLISKKPIMSPVWSPEGSKMAYVSFEGSRAGIYLQDIASGRRELLSSSPGINGAPAFSPDGKQLALVLTQSGNPKIYALSIKDMKLSQLTHGYSIDTEPSWSPDGKTVLFTSDRGGTPQVYQYNFADNKVDRVSYNGNYNAKASFLPSGQGVVMMHRDTGLFSIALQDLSSGQVQILSETGYDESPSLAPNGKMVLYDTMYGGRRVLAVVSTDGQIKVRLPSRVGEVQEPVWSPYLTS